MLMEEEQRREEEQREREEIVRLRQEQVCFNLRQLSSHRLLTWCMVSAAWCQPVCLTVLSSLQVHKAQPIRHYKPVTVKRSEVPLTVPHSPNFSDRFRL